MNKRFLIAAGGTGGHFYPGFSLGRMLNKQGCSVLFVVRQGDVASRVLADNRLKFVEIDFCAMPRTINPFKYISFVYKLVKSMRQISGVITQFKPDVSVGTGGYVSFPLIFMSHLKGIKTAVHDSNTRIGLANRVCSHFADLFLMGLPTGKKIKNSVLVGTPIRKEFADSFDRSKVLSQLGLNPAFTTVLLFGGSQGARNLNQALIDVVKRLVAENEDVQFIHISGERWYENITNRYGKISRVKVLAYSNEIYDLIHSCDLVVCRSGAGTLAELIYCKKPAILVPLPSAAANHQYYNAKILQSVGCAAIARESSHLQADLYTQMDRMLNATNNSVLQTMHENYAKLNLPDPLTAGQRITQQLKEL
ncbi:MAG: UDP-N-acetylglucosamine--N-acetylmuramyl-(pentapeptide) pyrophosphoryl-undecaprenol N-acetylglucosamine transferase [Elusimicrobiaceae bacterium]|nr:UDP-N-acetylglucosamine--N-acetylmuramyl-(pentapeptide) pyrophosphoryl-undecaprenol N-acetylglucosamine transferase [Elusimicrobiaceae bacterium]